MGFTGREVGWDKVGERGGDGGMGMGWGVIDE